MSNRLTESEFETVAIVGVGLIGASIGLALGQRQLARRVIGIGRRPAALKTALDLGAVTETTVDLATGVAAADLVIVCTPVDEIVRFVLEIARNCPRHTLITDVGSTKGHIVAELDRQLNAPPRSSKLLQADASSHPHFIGSHPLAGSEKTGPENARADLLVDRVVVLTPTGYSRPEACQSLKNFWSGLGAEVAELPPDQHDVALAATSHLPHLIAAALAANTPEAYLHLTAGGWLDTTRIAAGNVEMWRQIFNDNRSHLLQSLDTFEEILAAYRSALENHDDERLRTLLQTGKERREAAK